MKIETGQVAPDFSLYDSTKHKVTLSDLRGNKVLILFFPLAFTSVCTRELCIMRDSIGFYNDTSATVLAISIDSVYTLAAFKAEQNYNFPLLSDFNKDVSALYGSLYDTWKLDMKGVTKRSAFVIDREGIVRYAEVLEDTGDEPDYLKINNMLKSLS